jgi:hypothetical protein
MAEISGTAVINLLNGFELEITKMTLQSANDVRSICVQKVCAV